MDVEAARDRARLKAAALSARGGGEAQSSMHVFDRVVKAAQRDRAAYLRRAWRAAASAPAPGEKRA